MDEKALKSLFTAMYQSQLVYYSALKECWEWDERLKDDTGGYRGMEDVKAREYAKLCGEEYRAAFDAYVAARFGLSCPQVTSTP